MTWFNSASAASGKLFSVMTVKVLVDIFADLKLSSNLLYPKEDRENHFLMYTCRTCHVGEPASSYCVYQNKLNSQVGDTAGVTTDVGSDPTVGPPRFLYIPGFCCLCAEEITCYICGNLPEAAASEKEAIDGLCYDDEDQELIIYSSSNEGSTQS